MHVDQRGTNTVGRPWVAVPRRRSTRRTALAAALGLLAASLALPVVATPPTALADSGPRTFTATVPENVTGDGTFDVNLRLDNTSPRRGGGSGRELGSANVTVASDNATFLPQQVDPRVVLVDGTAELRDLGLLPQQGDDYGLRLDATCGTIVTFDVIAKQSNDFSGAGNELTLQEEGSQLTVTLDCGPLPYYDGLKSAICGEGVCTPDEDERGEHRLSASADSNQGVLYAGFRAAVNEGDDPIEQLAFDFSAACQELVEGRANNGEPYRLASEVAQVEPVRLDADGVTVRMTIPRSEVNTDANRSADVFTVCFLGDGASFKGSVSALYEGLDLDEPFLEEDLDIVGNPALFGPVLLPMCEVTGGAAPCIENRQKVRADVELTVRIRASDPWMR